MAKDKTVYIDFLNKDKGFKEDRIFFETYEDAVKWAKDNFERFDPDMIHLTMSNPNPDTIQLSPENIRTLHY